MLVSGSNLVGVCRHLAAVVSVTSTEFFFAIFESCISSESCAAMSDLHSKFALGPHHV